MRKLLRVVEFYGLDQNVSLSLMVWSLSGLEKRSCRSTFERSRSLLVSSRKAMDGVLKIGGRRRFNSSNHHFEISD